MLVRHANWKCIAAPLSRSSGGHTAGGCVCVLVVQARSGQQRLAWWTRQSSCSATNGTGVRILWPNERGQVGYPCRTRALTKGDSLVVGCWRLGLRLATLAARVRVSRRLATSVRRARQPVALGPVARGGGACRSLSHVGSAQKCRHNPWPPPPLVGLVMRLAGG